MAFEASHVVPQGGLPAWNTPDGSQPPAANLGAGTELQVVETQGGWARVEGSNGWTGWVDGTRLVARSGAVPPPPPPPAPMGQGALGLVGRPRKIGVSILLFLVTFGVYGIYWTFKTHDEIRNYSGRGVGGGIGLVIYLLAGFVTPFLIPSEVKTLFDVDGRPSPVNGATGLWVLPGILIIVGPFIWFARVQGALNAYWVSKGAPPL